MSKKKMHKTAIHERIELLETQSDLIKKELDDELQLTKKKASDIGKIVLGIGGGLVLIISPTGELIGIPVSEFKNIPFNSYLIPGIILFSVLGIIPSLLIIALLKKPISNRRSVSIYLMTCTGHGHSAFILL